MSSSHVDRNLLFGFLALQCNFITHEDLIAAVSIWLTDKSRPLAEIFAQRRALADDERQLLEALVGKHLQKHGNDAERSLAALSSVGKLRDDLKKLGDADVEASLAHVAKEKPAEPADPYATLPVDLDVTLPVSPNAALPVDPSTVEKSRFRILRPHAAGGLGQVYVARDDELNREVALKEIKFDHVNDANSRNRFLLEAEITGGLEHPGIVPVYGLGQYADGRPYYAMRFIRGDSLKEAIARFHTRGVGVPPAQKASSSPAFDSLEFRQLLGRFIDVCNAIEYAHSRGVLHRDLKPGNIMLGKYGETLVVDWGLAKAKERSEPCQQSDEHTLQPRSGSGSTATQMGSAIGTPAYMSPEQALGQLDKLGPASDVYSLGATLYSVLTGEVPFSMKSDVGDVLRRVQSGDFPRPRAVLSAIPSPLEAICLKAMALCPSDRHSSPQALADDVERFLADEPIWAYAEPLSVRTRRWLRKHPRTVAALAATLLVGITSTLLIAFIVADRNRQLTLANAAERAAKEQAVAATAAESEARLQAETAGLAEKKAKESALEREAEAKRANAAERAAREQAVAATLAEGEARQQAEQAAIAEKTAKESALEREAETKAVLDFVENRIFAAARPEGQAGGLGSEVSLRTAIEASLQFLDRTFADQPLIEARLRSTLGNSFGFLGQAQTAAEQNEAARRLFTKHRGADHPDTLISMNNLAKSYADLGRHAEALKLREQTLLLQKAKLGADHPLTLTSMNNLAGSYSEVGRHAEALELHEQTLALRQARLGADDPETLRSMNNLAGVYSDLGRHADATRLHEQTLALQKASLGEEHPDTLTSMNNLAGSYSELGRHAEAFTLHQQTLALRQAKLGAEHPNTLTSMSNLAYCHDALGRHAEALKLRQQTLLLQKAKLGADHPLTMMTSVMVSRSLLQLDRGSEAVPIIDECLERAAGKVLDPRVIPTAMQLRALHFQWMRDPAGCRATAEMWEKLNRGDPESLYSSARYRAITAAVIRAANSSTSAAQKADAEANRAMEWLRKAVAAGYKNAAQMAQDKDFDVLRDRDDFKQLLTTLQARQGDSK